MYSINYFTQKLNKRCKHNRHYIILYIKLNKATQYVIYRFCCSQCIRMLTNCNGNKYCLSYLATLCDCVLRMRIGCKQHFKRAISAFVTNLTAIIPCRLLRSYWLAINMMMPEAPNTPSRHEKSLGLLTIKFVNLLQEAHDGVLDLKVVSVKSRS